MKNRLFLILILIGLSVKLNAQYGTSDATFTYQVDGTKVMVVPNINIPTNLIVSYSWTFGDGTESDVPNPREHDYLISGTFRISLSVQYLDKSGAISSSTTLGDVNVLATEPFVEWVTVGDETPPNDPDPSLEPSLDISQYFPVDNQTINCSIGIDPGNEIIHWELFVDGELEGGHMLNTRSTEFNLQKGEGTYTLQLKVSYAFSPEIWAKSNPVTIIVGNYNTGSNPSGCPTNNCFHGEVFSDKAVLLQGNTGIVTFQTHNVPASSGSSCTLPETTLWEDTWSTKKLPDGTPRSIPSSGSTVNGYYPPQTLSNSTSLSSLEAGEHLISYYIKATDQNGNCVGGVGGSTKVLIKSELSFENPQFPTSPTLGTPYNLDFPFSGGTETVVINGTETITTGVDYKSKGSIMVDGDWIHIDRFTHNELRISCSQSESEDRFGRIIVTFPNTYEQKIIYVSQPRSFWEVENNDDLAVAIQNVEDGSKIVLKEGTYNVPIKILGKNITLTSKFLETGDPYYIDNTIIDANNEGSVVKLVGDGSFEGTTRIVGMHLTGGNSEEGGGIYCSSANLDLEHVLIHSNYGDKGGGIYASNANININHITLLGNESDDDPSGVQLNRKLGHMIYLRDNSDITITNSILGTNEDERMGAIFYDATPGDFPYPKITIDYTRLVGSSVFAHSNDYTYYSTSVWIPYHHGSFAQDWGTVDEQWEIGFQDPDNQNYWLSSESFYRNDGTDGKDYGALFHVSPYIGNAVISINPESLEFENTISGESVTQEIEITNLINYKVTGGIWLAPYERDPYGLKIPFDVDDFSVVPNKLSLDIGETKKIYVTFKPESFGEKRGRIDIKTYSSPETFEIPINGESVTKPDLTGETSGNIIEINSGHYLWGHGFSYWVLNNGGTTSKANKVKFYLSPHSNTIEWATLLTEQVVPPMEPHSTISVLQPDLITIPQETSTGSYFIISIVDADDEIDEHYEDNNWTVQEINVTQTYPALSVSDVKVLDTAYEFEELGAPGGRPGDDFKVHFRVNNSSEENLEYNLKVYLSKDGAFDASDIEIGAILNDWITAKSADPPKSCILDLTIPENIDMGGYNLLFRAYETAIPEDNYLINTTVQPFQIFRLPDYDLLWSQEYLIPFFPGEQFELHVSINNWGNSDAPATDVKFFLSSDQNYDAQDTELGSISTEDFTQDEPFQQLSYTVTIPNGFATGNWHIVSYVDPDNLIEEADETNNTNYTPIQINNFPDLLMQSISLSANNVMAGSSVNVSCSVSNIDFGVAPESKLKFYLSENDVLHHSNDIELGEVTVSELANGEIFNVSDFELPIPFETAGGNWYIIAKADGEAACPNSWCDIKESNEDNNIVMGQISVWRQPDLYFESTSIRKDNAITSSFIEGADIDLYYYIWHSNGEMNSIGQNNGLSYAGDHILRTYLSDDVILDTETDIRLSSIVLGNSEGNTSFEGVLPMTLPENMEGTQWFVIAVIDVNNQVDERDETNNTWVQEITITDKPDLEIQSFSVEPLVAIQGVTNALHFSSFVKNMSPMNKISYAYVDYYFSVDNVLSPDDKFIHSVSASLSDDINNEATMPTYNDGWETSDWSQGIYIGQYYLIAETHPSAGTIESSLENNVLAIPFEIVQPTDLEIVNLNLDRTTIQEGSDFTVTCTVRNNNVTASEPTTLLLAFDPWQDFSNSSHSYVFESIEVGSLAQGQTTNITRTYTAPTDVPAYYFHAICDMNNVNVEADKNNNKVNIPISLQAVYPPLEVNVEVTPPTSNGGSDGEVRCIVSGGDGQYSYAWYKNGNEIGTGNWLYNTEAGEYLVQVNDLSGGTGTESFIVTEPNQLVSFASTVQHVTTHNGNDGIIEIEITDGNPPYQISVLDGYSEMWPVGKTSGTISGLASGWHNIIISDANSAVSGVTNSHSVYINNVIDVVYSAANVSKYGANNGSINVNNVNGAVAPYTYSWLKDDTEISTDAGITNLSPGTYILKITDNTGNTKTETIQITEPNELIVEYTVTDVSVTGQSDGAIDLTVVSGNPPYTFQWQNGNTNEDVSNWPAGEYMVTITDVYHSVTEYITIGQPFAITTTNHVNVTTPGGNNGRIVCSVTGGFSPYQYTWQKDGQPYTTGTSSIYDIAVGLYELLVEDVEGNTVLKTFTVTEPDVLTGTITPIDVSTYNGSDGQVEIDIQSGNPPYQVLWDENSETWPAEQSQGTIGSFAPSSFFVEVRDASGQSLSEYITIDNPLVMYSYTVTNVRSHGGNDGAILINPQGGITPYTYFWTKDSEIFSTDKNLENLEAGLYEITVTDNIGGTVSRSFTVNEPNELIVDYSVTDANGSDNSDGRIDLTIRSGNPPYTFDWTKQLYGDISNDEDLINISPGTYSVRVWDSKGHFVDISGINIQPLKIHSTVNPITANGANDGIIRITQPQANPSTFEWSYNGEFYSSSNEINNLLPGEYSVTVTDRYGLSNSETFTMTEPEEFLIEYATIDVSSSNGNDGAIDITVSGGTLPYTFAWHKNGLSVGITEDLQDLEAGRYQLRVTDKYGNIIDRNIDIVDPLYIPYTSHLKTNNTIAGGAEGQIISLGYEGHPPYNLVIYKDGIEYSSFENLNHGEAVELNSLLSGEYYAILTDSKGNTAHRTYNVTDPISVQLSSKQLSGPEDDAEISVEVNGGLPPYTFNWTKDNVFYSNEKDLNSLSTGNYNLTLTDSEGRTASSFEIINVFLPSVTISGGGSICENEGEATIIFELTGTPPWRIDLNNGTSSFQIAGINETPYYFTTNSPGTYQAIGGRDNNYSFGSRIYGSAIVEMEPEPTATISGGGSLCANTEGVTVAIDFTGEAPWSATYTNGTLTYLLEDITESHYEFVTDHPGTYTITSVNDATCTGTASGVAEVIEVPLPIANISGGKGICNNQGAALVSIQLTGTAPWDFTYSDGTNSYTVNGITEPLYEITTNAAGIYSVTEVSDATGCPGYSVSTLEVGNHQLPTASISGETACENDGANLNFTLTGYAPWTVSYTDGTTTSEITAWANDFELPVSTEGTYHVTALSDNFCTGTDFGAGTDVIITPTPTVNLGEDASICEGSSHILNAGSDFSSYRWNGQAGSSQLEVSTPGVYIVEVTDNNGCTATDEVELSVNALPEVNLGPDITAPADAFIYLEAEPGYQSYEWPGNNTCQILCVSMQNVSTSAEVWLNVTDENGCVGTDQIRLTLAEPPQTITSEEETDTVSTSTITINQFDVNEEEVLEDKNEDVVTYRLFPNPTTGKLSIIISDPSKVKSIKVYDLNGNLVKSFDYILNNKVELDLTDYAKGVYLIRSKEVNTMREFKIIRQ